MPIVINCTYPHILHPVLASFKPVFTGVDFSPLSIIQNATGFQDVGTLFSVQQGTMTFTDVGAAPAGVTFNGVTGRYSWAGAVTPGTYSMITRASGSTIPVPSTDYAWTLIVNTIGGTAPIFSGPIADKIQSGNFTYDVSGFASGQTSYSKTGNHAGITFNTSTGIFTVTAATSGTGTFGPFTVSYINAFGTTVSNQFFIQVIVSGSGSKKDFIGHWVRFAGAQTTALRTSALNDAHSTAVKHGGRAAPDGSASGIHGPYVWSTLGNTQGWIQGDPVHETGYQTNMITGFIFNYMWKDIEPTQGSYPLFGPNGQITQDLQWCAARGLFYIMMVVDRTFSSAPSSPGTPGTPGPKPLGDWMDSLSGFPMSDTRGYPLQVPFPVRAGVGAGGVGYTSLRYKPEYAASMKALSDAISAAYDDPLGNNGDNAYFHGVTFQESAIGNNVSPGTQKLPAPWTGTTGYSATLYIASLKDYLGYANTVLTNSRVYWMQNFLVGNPNGIGDVINTVGKDLRVGGPDLKPDEGSLTGPGPGVASGGITSNFDGPGQNLGPPVWGDKTSCYNNYWNDSSVPSPPPTSAIELGNKTFCCVASGDDVGAAEPHDTPYKPRSTTTGGIGANGTGLAGAITGNELPKLGWIAGDSLDWGRRNLQLTSIWWYQALMDNDGPYAKTIWFQRPPFNNLT